MICHPFGVLDELAECRYWRKRYASFVVQLLKALSALLYGKEIGRHATACLAHCPDRNEDAAGRCLPHLPFGLPATEALVLHDARLMSVAAIACASSSRLP